MLQRLEKDRKRVEALLADSASRLLGPLELAEVTAALTRVIDGTYGLFKWWGKMIDAEQLVAASATRCPLSDNAEFERANVPTGRRL